MNKMDEELERIKMRKMAEMLSGRTAERKTNEPMVGPIELNDTNFDSFIRENDLSLVDFWAEWCAPCRAIAPTIKEIAHEYAGKVAVGKLNVDENPQTTMRFGIMSIPTLMIFKRGRVVDTIVGAVPKRAIVSRLSSYL